MKNKVFEKEKNDIVLLGLIKDWEGGIAGGTGPDHTSSGLLVKAKRSSSGICRRCCVAGACLSNRSKFSLSLGEEMYVDGVCVSS